MLSIVENTQRDSQTYVEKRSRRNAIEVAWGEKKKRESECVKKEKSNQVSNQIHSES